MAVSARTGKKGIIFLLVVGLILATNACAVVRGEAIVRVALLAPFEGRYREVGYDALYAARLALHDSGQTHVELLPIDDGGTTESAVDRANALAQDPLVKAVILLGIPATRPETQRALGDIPALVVGEWVDQPASDGVFMLTNPDLATLIDVPGIGVTDAAALEAPVVGGVVFALHQFPDLRDSLDGITVASSASLPSPEFRERYMSSDPFAPEPGLLATLTYDAVNMIVGAIHDDGQSRGAVRDTLAAMTNAGLNGDIHFENNYWANAPIYYYQYDENRQLTRTDGVVK